MNNPRTHAVLPVLLGLAACAAPPAEIDMTQSRAPEFTEVNPSDIAVLKVEDATEGGQVGSLLDYMREAISRGLITRNYAPISPVYVDAHMRAGQAAPGSSIVDASYLSALAKKAQEDAIFAVVIHHWDDRSILLNNRVAFDAEVKLWSSDRSLELWSASLRGEVVAGGGKAAPVDPEARRQAAALEFVKELVGRMPRRQI